jgi:indolepyruvate ferredoxin oxidoreductase
MTLADVHLTDRFDLTRKDVLLSGTQAIVRLTMMQHERDKIAGLDTACFVSGYRGSPLGGLDQQFVRSKSFLEDYGVVFQPGLNEDMAATAVWGSQQSEMRGEGKHDGVYGIWYGKGPGVDRCGDVFRHANMAGSSKNGGVLVLMGDDHTAESSTVPHQSEFILMDVMMPVLNPAGVQELLDYGTLGWALSRYSGCWVGLKCVKDTIESTTVVDASVDRIKVVEPSDFEMPEGGLNIRPWDDRHEQEARMHEHKRFAAVAFARANNIDRMILNGGRAPKIGVVSTGKSYLDVREAFDELGIDEVTASKLGVRLLKIGMSWPLDPEIVTKFARGLDLIVVVEEKRSLIETQIREQLYGTSKAPVIIGKKDEDGNSLFVAKGALDPNQIAIEFARRFLKRHDDKKMADALARLEQAESNVRNTPNIAERIPYFCAGCPHNSSTVVPEGGRAYAGIGCHWMVQYIPERLTEGTTHMGGEGANWIGEAPFSTRRHVFQNLGDGTYNHSGVLALRACIAAGVNVTYKILYNDAVAMTGGQPHEGNLTVPMIARQVMAEGAQRVAIVSDEPDKYGPGAGFPEFTSFNHRDDIDHVQKELQEFDGVTVLIYDQTCAAEKRRRRKRGLFPDPPKRVFINELVCEGCGDCGVQSNCVAVTPKETEFGRKRKIDQSVCNKDYSCVNGFCPSFVTVHGGALTGGKASTGTPVGARAFDTLPEPAQPALARPYGILITGIGGTGVVTLGQIIGMAAHLEGKGAGIIDMAGLSQKNGSVVTHMKIASSPDDIQTIRLAAGGADLVLGCDLVTTGAEKNLSTVRTGATHVVVNAHEQMTAQFTRDADFSLPSERLRLAIEARAGRKNVDVVAANRLATALLGDSIGSNLFIVGYAAQKGLLPMSVAAIERAIELNGVSVEMNSQAFLWGRRAAHDAAAVEQLLDQSSSATQEAEAPQTLQEMIDRRADFLAAYQNNAYGQKYRSFVAKVSEAEAAKTAGRSGLAEAVARYYFKLLAYKDEYEVARLYTDGSFAREVAKQFTGDYKLKYHLAPPILGRRDEHTGLPRKTEFGSWMKPAFAILARFKGLRGTAFDPFGYSDERRTERALIAEYEKTIESVLGGLHLETHELAVEIAQVPEQIRGYGHVKARNIEAARESEKALMERFGRGTKSQRAAA